MTISVRLLLFFATTTLFVVTATSAVLSAGCSAPDASARIDPIGPDRAQFDSVAPMLARRCGSIDCHGSIYRNLRVYGYGGTRLSDASATSALRPDFPAIITTDEAEATYQAVVALEPEVMRSVVLAGGAGPERLTLVRKARDEERHKGHRRITPGDDADRCLLTWLASSVDVTACRAAGCVGDGDLIEGEGCAQ